MIAVRDELQRRQADADRLRVLLRGALAMMGSLASGSATSRAEFEEYRKAVYAAIESVG